MPPVVTAGIHAHAVRGGGLRDQTGDHPRGSGYLPARRTVELDLVMLVLLNRPGNRAERTIEVDGVGLGLTVILYMSGSVS